MAQTRKQLSHDRILDAAARAIRSAGYQKAGVARIMKDAGLTHGGFYAHFPSLDALLVEAMQHAGRLGAEALRERMREQQPGGGARFASLVESYLHDGQLVNPECGCVVAALASEMPRLEGAALEAARTRVQTMIELVRGALPAGADPDEAGAIAATMIGALQLARTFGGKAGRSLLASTRRFLRSRYEAGGLAA
jgi:AcrR family transcriptional regulator